jgi:F-type H+-transporting ATPase subunit delta
MWKHPVVDVADKQAILKQLLGGRAHPLTLNGLLLLFDKKRGMLVDDVQRAFRARFDATRRRATVKVTSAMPLDQGQADQLRQQLGAKLAKDIQMETAVDPSLIGGMVVQLEDQVIDNSVRGRLEALRHALN